MMRVSTDYTDFTDWKREMVRSVVCNEMQCHPEQTEGSQSAMQRGTV